MHSLSTATVADDRRAAHLATAEHHRLVRELDRPTWRRLRFAAAARKVRLLPGAGAPVAAT